MKTKLRPIAILTSLFATAVFGAPLPETTAVHIQPAGASPVLTYLKAGSEPLPSSTVTDAPPQGWMAIAVPGPRDGYVQNKDILKSLDVRPGAAVYLTPDTAAGVMATAGFGEKFEITGLRGKWTQVRVTKDLLGYIQVTSTNSFASHTPYTPAPASMQSASPTNAAPFSYSEKNAAGQPAPMIDSGDGGSSSLPRALQGKFVSSKSLFGGKKPYEWALNDSTGQRYAYVDISKLLLTELLDKYIDHTVAVFGTAKNIPGTKDIVVFAESIQLK